MHTVQVQPLLGKFTDGYNATIFAYGQTGSGKTHTMGSAVDGSDIAEDTGIVQRVAHHLFEHITSAREAGTECSLQCSYMEIYNEEIVDLLDSDSSKTVTVRENADGGQTISGIQTVPVPDVRALGKVLSTGAAARSVGSTKMNAVSSRSHAVFTLTLEQTRLGADDAADTPAYTCSKLHLVDLAGSERQKKTQASGTRLREAAFINKGLLALGNVINALSEAETQTKGGKGGHRHVPYRDSKLTRLLQDSLGGNSHTLMIACVSSADSNFDETLNTLRYAQRASCIQNKASVNTDPHTAQVVALQKQVRQLQLALMASQGGEGGQSIAALTAAFASGGAASGNAAGSSDDGTSALTDALARIAKLETRNGDLNKECSRLRSAWSDANDEVIRLREELASSRSATDELRWDFEMMKHVTLPAQAEAAGGADAGAARGGDSAALTAAKAMVAERGQMLQALEAEVAALKRAAADTAAKPKPQKPKPVKGGSKPLAVPSAIPDAAVEQDSDSDSEHADDSDEETDPEEAEHMSRQTAMRAELGAIDGLLLQKQALLADLSKSSAAMGVASTGDSDAGSNASDPRVAELEEELGDLKARLAKAEAAAAKAGATPTAFAVSAAAALKKQLAAKEAKLAELRSKVGDTGRLRSLQRRSEARVVDLSREIESVKAARVSLLRKLKGDANKFREAQAARRREVASLNKRQQRTAMELSRLRSSHDKQAAVLRRKTEELMAANRSMKEAAAAARARSRKAGGAAAGATQSDAAAAVDPQVAALLDADVAAVQLVTSVPAATPLLSRALAHDSVKRVPPAARVALAGELSARLALQSSRSLMEELVAQRQALTRTAREARAQAAVEGLTARQRSRREAEAQKAGRTLEQEVADAQATASEATAGARELSRQIATLQDSVASLDETLASGVSVASANAPPATREAGQKWHAVLPDAKSAKRAVWWLANALAEYASGVQGTQRELEEATAAALGRAAELEDEAAAARQAALTASASAAAAERAAEARVHFWMQSQSAALTGNGEDDVDMPSMDEISTAVAAGGDDAGVRGTPARPSAQGGAGGRVAALQSMVSAQARKLEDMSALHETLDGLAGEKDALAEQLESLRAALRAAEAREATAKGTAAELQKALDTRASPSKAGARVSAGGSGKGGKGGSKKAAAGGSRSKGGAAEEGTVEGVVYYDAEGGWDFDSSDSGGDDDDESDDDSDWEDAGSRPKRGRKGGAPAVATRTRRSRRSDESATSSATARSNATTGSKQSSAPGQRKPSSAAAAGSNGRTAAGSQKRPRPTTSSGPVPSARKPRTGGVKRPALGSVSANTQPRPHTGVPSKARRTAGASSPGSTAPPTQSLVSKGRTSVISAASRKPSTAGSAKGRLLYTGAKRPTTGTGGSKAASADSASSASGSNVTVRRLNSVGSRLL